MSEVAELINRYGKSFCVLPWKHIFIRGDGIIRLCCLTPPLESVKDQPLNIYTTLLKDIWNSNAMRNIRQAMISGETIPNCKTCMVIEKSGGRSRRLQENQAWEAGWVSINGISIENLKNDSIKNYYFVEHSPFDIGIEVDNICNLACRMCCAYSSSRIEKDPIHNRWAKRLQNTPTWVDNEMQLGPTKLISGIYRGFKTTKDIRITDTLWTNGKAEIHLPNLNEHLESLTVRLSPDSSKQRIQIFVNGTNVYTNQNDRLFSQNINTDLKSYYSELKIRFESKTKYLNFFHKPVELGIEHIAIKRNASTMPSTHILNNRFSEKKHWMEDDDFLFQELFPPAANLKRLNIVAGEPLINQNVLTLIKHLATQDNSENILIAFTTNGSVYNEEVLNMAKQFKGMNVALSIDAVGKSIEYIRHGIRWQTLKDNMQRMMATKNVLLMVATTLQAYNALEISDVFRLCDRYNLRIMGSVVAEPKHLSIAVLPLKVREKAVQRLQEYIDENDDNNSENRNFALLFVRAFNSEANCFSPHELHKFMLFSNDLDRSRKQNIKKTFPELIQLIESDGHPWIDDTFFYSKDKQSS